MSQKNYAIENLDISTPREALLISEPCAARYHKFLFRCFVFFGCFFFNSRDESLICRKRELVVQMFALLREEEFLSKRPFFLNAFLRLTDNLVALKEIRLEHEEGAPCTAIREGT